MVGSLVSVFDFRGDWNRSTTKSTSRTTLLYDSRQVEKPDICPHLEVIVSLDSRVLDRCQGTVLTSEGSKVHERFFFVQRGHFGHVRPSSVFVLCHHGCIFTIRGFWSFHYYQVRWWSVVENYVRSYFLCSV